MKQFLVIAVSLLLFSCGTEDKKESLPSTPLQDAVEVKPSKHSDAFNANLNGILDAYFSMKDALVTADVEATKKHGAVFAQKLDSISFEELKKDSGVILDLLTGNITDLKGFAANITKESDVTKIREQFKAISETLYPSFLMGVKYDGKPLYWQNCPMAFNGDQEANWISKTEEIINPYLGNNHPKYKDKMLSCGRVLDTIRAK